MKTFKKSIPPFVKHRDHPTEIRRSLNYKNAFYYCTQCQVWIGSLSKKDTQNAQELDMIANSFIGQQQRPLLTAEDLGI